MNQTQDISAKLKVNPYFASLKIVSEKCQPEIEEEERRVLAIEAGKRLRKLNVGIGIICHRLKWTREYAREVLDMKEGEL